MKRLDIDLKISNVLINQMANEKRSYGEKKNRFIETVELLEGKIIVRVFGFNNEKGKLNYVECMRMSEDGDCIVRNLEFSCMGGWRVRIPNIPYTSYYYCYDHTEVWEWEQRDKIPNIMINYSFDLKQVIGLDNSLKYLINKISASTNSKELLKMIGNYRKHPELETLYSMGLNSIANDKRLFKLRKDKLKQVISFIKSNTLNFTDDSLSKVLTCIKNNIKLNDYNDFKWSKGNKKLFKYIKTKNINRYEYDDYIRMCVRCNHNIEDDYWKYPNDFIKAHDKVMTEYNRIIESERLIAERKKLKELMKNENKIKNIAEKLNKFNSNIQGYMIYIPNSIKDISNQAKVLHQCLITADYVSKMARKECILIFIKKGNNPIATAEIDYNKNLKQFYGNELDRTNCKPTEEVTNVFNQWLTNIKINKLSVMSNA